MPADFGGAERQFRTLGQCDQLRAALPQARNLATQLADHGFGLALVRALGRKPTGQRLESCQAFLASAEATLDQVDFTVVSLGHVDGKTRSRGPSFPARRRQSPRRLPLSL